MCENRAARTADADDPTFPAKRVWSHRDRVRPDCGWTGAGHHCRGQWPRHDDEFDLHHRRYVSEIATLHLFLACTARRRQCGRVYSAPALRAMNVSGEPSFGSTKMMSV